MTLDFDFWLKFCSREEFSFRNVYVSMVEGANFGYIRKKKIDSRNTD